LLDGDTPYPGGARKREVRTDNAAFYRNYTDKKDINGLKNSISKANDLLTLSLSTEQIVSLNYSIATAYADIEHIDFMQT